MHVNEIIFIEVLRDKVSKINNTLIKSKSLLIDVYLLHYVCCMADTCKIWQLIDILESDDVFKLSKFFEELHITVKPMVYSYNETAVYKQMLLIKKEKMQQQEEKGITFLPWHSTMFLLLNALKEALYLRRLEIDIALEIYYMIQD